MTATAGAARLRSLLIATVAIALATAVRYLLDPILGDRTPYGTFFLAMLAVAWFGDLLAASVALVVGALVGTLLFVSPNHSLLALSFGDWIGLASYFVVGIASLTLSEALRRTGRREVARSAQLLIHQRLLESSELRYRSLVNATSSIVFAADSDGGCKEPQNSWEAFTGQTWPDYADLGWLSCVHADDRQSAGEAWQHARQLNAPCEAAFRLWNAQESEYRHVILRAVPVSIGGGNPSQWICTVTDVHDERRALDSLQVSENRFRLMADSAPVLLWISGPDGKYSFVNKPWLEFTGRILEEELGDGWLQRVHPDDLQHTRDTYQAALAARQPFEMEYRLLRADGEYRWMLDGAAPLFTPGGEFVGFIGSCKDITLRRLAEEMLRHSEHQFRTMADAMPQIAWAARPDGHLDYYNQRWYEFTGLEPGQEGDESWKPILHPEDLDRCVKLWSEAVGSGEIYDIEYRLRDRSGNYRWHLGRALPVRDLSHKIVRWFGTCTDIDDTKQSAERLKAADRAKGEFLANISHELRTPMNAIIGMTDLALSEELPAVVRDFLSTARGSADVLLGLLNEILDFSRLESGKLVLEAVPFDLRATIDDTVKTMAVKAYEKGLELACDLPDDVPDELVGDPLRLKQILMNLLGNAVKFTERGEVVLRLSVESQTSSEVCLKFAIRDTGIGISPADQQRIFTPFTQADASTTRHYGGTGLGLAIATELVRIMGGNLWVESRLGQGSTFSFTARLLLDTAPRRCVTPAKSAVQNLRGMPVLVVDDNQTNRAVLQTALESWHMRPVVVADGHAALEAIHQAAKANQTFPLVLLDALMPGMDGFTLATWIRGEPNLAGATVLMLSSADRQAFARRCEQLDDAIYLEKPVAKSELLEAILSALGLAEPITASENGHSSWKSATADRKLHILVAEDTPANQKLMQSLLSRRGHDVEIAHNGREAVELVRQRAFDLVIMDVQMPIMDGFQATAAIRAQQDPAGRRLPILAMTAHAMRGDSQRCLAAGMDAYLSKPIDCRKLFELIDSLAGEKEVEMDQNHAHQIEPQSPVVNLDAALERMGGSPQLLEDIVQYYFQDYPGLIEQIERAISTRDSAQLERAAHSLKGLAANFDASQVVETAASLEALGRSSQFEQAERELESLQTRIAELNRQLHGRPKPAQPLS